MNSASFKEKYKSTLIVYFALVFSILIYAGLIPILKNNPELPLIKLPVEQLNLIKYILFGISIFNYFVAAFIRKVMLVQLVASYHAGLKVASAEPSGRIPNFMAVEVVTFAICESVAIYGLVLYLIGKRPEDFYTQIILALLFFILYFPKPSKWAEWEKAINVEGKN